ncbi:MAG TPA: Wadjet anti-phage system protein JetD domain-containing protein [Candidatus Ozemobacteraceae bacterium]
MSTLQERLNEYKHTYINTVIIESWFQEYSECFDAVTKAISNGMLTPVKSSGGNGRVPPLAARYRITPPQSSASDELRHSLLSLPLPLRGDHYAFHPAHYTEDRDLIESIAAYVRRRGRETPCVIPANERSFELFGNEKMLLGRGVSVLRRLGATLDILDCYKTSEPFVCYPFAPVPQVVLISENRDPFSSLNTIFRTSSRRLGVHTIDALIYGEGRKILKSISFSREILNPDPASLLFLYWGDLDAEGIAILLELRRAWPELRIEPAGLLYETMLARMPAAPPSPRSTRSFDIAPFFDLLPPGIAQQADQLIRSGRYLPQEAVPFTILKSLVQPC